MVDSKLVKGTITVAADNVTIRRTLIRNAGTYPIQVADGSRNLLVQDVEIDGQATGSAAVCCGHYTLRRVDIYGVNEGPRVGTNTTIVDSYIHHLHRCSGCHIDALQTTAGSNVLIKGNNLQAYNPVTKDPMNAAYQLGTTHGQVYNVVVEDNLLNGGNATVNAGGGGTSDAKAVFRRNRFGRDYRYGPTANFGPGISFDSSNVWHDSGKPVLS